MRQLFRPFCGRKRSAALLCAALFLAGIFCACAAAETEPLPTMTAAPTALPSPTPTPAPTPTPVPTPFSLLWMSDTQRTAGHRGEFAALGQWCMEQIGPYNIQALLHTGDIVDVYCTTLKLRPPPIETMLPLDLG